MLSAALADGTIPPGSALPPETELMRLYAVGRNTVRRALGRLEREQRVVRRRGSGTFARESDPSQLAWKRLSSMLFDFERYAQETSASYNAFKKIDTPDVILQSAVNFGSRCLCVEVVRSFNGRHFSYSVSHVVERVSAKLTRRRLGNRLVLVALKELGFAPSSATQVTRAVTATAKVAERLDVAESAPLLVTETLTRDADGLPLEHHQCIYRPDVYPLQLQLRYDSMGPGLRWQAVPISSPA